MTPEDIKRLRKLAHATAARGYCSVTSSDLFALLDALEAQERATTDGARDAERYRWLREQSHDNGKADIYISPTGHDWDWDMRSGDHLDATIDYAIAEQAKERTP